MNLADDRVRAHLERLKHAWDEALEGMGVPVVRVPAWRCPLELVGDTIRMANAGSVGVKESATPCRSRAPGGRPPCGTAIEHLARGAARSLAPRSSDTPGPTPGPPGASYGRAVDRNGTCGAISLAAGVPKRADEPSDAAAGRPPGSVPRRHLRHLSEYEGRRPGALQPSPLEGARVRQGGGHRPRRRRHRGRASHLLHHRGGHGGRAPGRPSRGHRRLQAAHLLEPLGAGHRRARVAAPRPGPRQRDLPGSQPTLREGLHPPHLQPRLRRLEPGLR